MVAEASTIDESEAFDQFTTIQDVCRAAEQNFMDDTFSPSPESIGNNAGDNGYIWLRPCEMGSSKPDLNWSVFADPQSTDIKQGSLGDCWFLSALAIVAERPEVLEKIFVSGFGGAEYSEEGVYLLRLCIDGQWRLITVDDYFPCHANSKTFAFASAKKNQLWVPLAEKALAKALGSYHRLKSGNVVEGLAYLTGAPGDQINLEDVKDDEVDMLWKKLVSAIDTGYLMGAACGSGSWNRVSKEQAEAMGLVTNHAYSVLDVKEEATIRLVRVRNPWGRKRWIGDWSNEWEGWPAELKSRLLPTANDDDGTFWMEFDDFSLYFYRIDIARVRDHHKWTELRIPCTIGGTLRTKDTNGMTIIVEEPTEVCISLFRRGGRVTDTADDLFLCVHELSPCGESGDALVGRLVLRSARSFAYSVTTGDNFLSPGQYVITAFSLKGFGSANGSLDAAIVLHSSKPIFAMEQNCSVSMLARSLHELAASDEKPFKVNDSVRTRAFSKGFSGFLIVTENLHPTLHAHIAIDCSNSSNVIFPRGAVAVDSVPPKSRKIMHLLTIEDTRKGSTYSYKIDSCNMQESAMHENEDDEQLFAGLRMR